MQPRTALISLLIVASVLVDLAAVEFADHDQEWWAAKVLLASLAVSQVALVSLWAGLGRTWVYVRLTGVLGVCWLLSQMFGEGTPEERAQYFGEPETRHAWLIALVTGSWPIVVILWSWRVHGMRLMTATADTTVVDLRPNRWPQFRIVDVLGATFVASLLLAMLRQLAEPYPIWPSRGLLFLMALPLVTTTVAIAALSLLLAWLILRHIEPFSRVAALAASLIVGGAMGFVSISSDANPLLGSVTLFLPLTTMLLAGSLVVCRVAGYRLATGHFNLPAAPERLVHSAMATR